MNDMNEPHEESKRAQPDTMELLASLFEEPKESKIKRVRAKIRPKSVAKKITVVNQTKDVQQQRPMNRRAKGNRPSDSKIRTKAKKEETPVQMPAASRVITVNSSRIKARAQEKRYEVAPKKRPIPGIRGLNNREIKKSNIRKEARPEVSDRCVLSREVSSRPQRGFRFGSTILSIGLPFAIGILVSFLGTHYTPFASYYVDEGTVSAKKEMVENSAPQMEDAAILNAPAAAVDTVKQRNEYTTSEPPTPIDPEVEESGGVFPNKPNPPVSQTPRETTITVNQTVSSTNPDHSMSTQNSGEAARNEKFQRDAAGKSYPYSVYFGSYKHIDSAQKAISRFRETTGLSPYWVRVDLREKGVWYRVLGGYFQTRDEVETFIKEHQITEGRSRYVLYANLIGSYSYEEELNKKSLSLLELGYCPYVIKGMNGESLLFSGAFYYKADAEREHIELASKGIRTRLVKR